MTLSITSGVNNARLIGLRDYLDGGTVGAKIRIYGGTRPTLASDAAGSAILTEIQLTKPCGSVTSNQLVLTPDGLAQIINSGIATWARIVKDGDSTGIDGDVSLLAGSGDIKISDSTLWSGAYVSLISAVLV